MRMNRIVFFIDKEKTDALGINYNEKYLTSQDYGFLCECISKGAEIGFCSKTLLGWRDHNDQISKTKKECQKADANAIRRDYISKNFILSPGDLEVLISNLDNNTYEKNFDIENTERALQNFIKNNPNRIMDLETHKFWLQQSLKRLIRKRKLDFISTKMFRGCFRPDRFLYSFLILFLERKHIIIDIFRV